MQHRLLARRACAIFAIVALMAGMTPTAVAYDGTAAASYADAHWDECGDDPGWDDPAPSPYICYGNDCTNFASRVMHSGGGYRFIEGSTANPNDQWYWYNSGLRSQSWGVAWRLYMFLIYYDKGSGSRGGGTLVKDTIGVTASQQYNSLVKGDLIFFDWENDKQIDHVRVATGYGPVSSPGFRSTHNAYWATGDHANQHEAPRYHDFWNGYYVMSASRRVTTRVYQVHIPITSG